MPYAFLTVPNTLGKKKYKYQPHWLDDEHKEMQERNVEKIQRRGEGNRLDQLYRYVASHQNEELGSKDEILSPEKAGSTLNGYMIAWTINYITIIPLGHLKNKTYFKTSDK